MSASAAPTGPKTWHAGTLVYTTGGLVLLFCWLLLGDFAQAARERAIPTTVQLLFKRFGASDTLVGVLFASLPAALGLFLGPIIGYQSDRFRSRWGRRIPFLIAPTPLIVAGLVGLAFAPEIGAFVHRFGGRDLQTTVLVCLGVCWTIFEIGCVSMNGVFLALINDIVPPSIIGRFFGLFRVFSLLPGIILSFWVMGEAENRPDLICLGVAVLYGFGFVLMCLKVKEGDYPPPPGPPRGTRAKANALAAVRAYFRDSFSNPYYLLIFTAPMLCFTATMPFNLYSVFYRQTFGMSMDRYFDGLGISLCISLALAYPLGILADRLHPLRLSLLVTVLYACVMAGGIFYVKDERTFFALIIAHYVLSGTYYTTSASILMRLLPRAKFAELASAAGVISGIATIVLPAGLGTLLDARGNDYRYLCHAGLVLAVAGVLLGLVLYRRFVALGGPKNYRVPG